MARWTGAWLPGTGTAEGDTAEPRWRGERLGLPADGVGAVASGGRRLLALVLDFAVAFAITALFRRPELQDTAVMQAFNLWSSLTWAVITVVPVALFGFTPGMAATGIRVARLDGGALVGPLRALVRCVLTAVLIPAALRNADGRNWPDRATGSVVIRMR